MFLATKFFIPPPAAGRLPRQRLLELLDGALQPACRLALVCAPAGYGKSTLVADWISRHALAVHSPKTAFAWISLDREDDDPARFFSALAAAVERALPGVGAPAAMLLRSPQPVEPRMLVTALLNDLAASGRPLVVVLEDLQVIQSAPVYEALAFAIDHLPPDVHFVLATRSDPPLPLARYRARGQMLEVRTADLRFTRDEIDSLLSALPQIGLANAAQLLEDRTEGWPAGLQMALLSLRGKEDPARFLQSLSGTHRYIIDYLAEEVLAGLSEPTQRFLLAASLFDRFCAPLMDVVMVDGAGSAQSVLAELERANLFLISLDDERRWYRFHHLFTDLLRVRLKASSQGGPAAAADLHSRAALWLETGGSVPEAIQHALLAGDDDLAARLVEQHANTLVAWGRLQDVLAWVGRLPPDLPARRPWLALYQAWALAFAGQVAEARAALDRVDAVLAGAAVGSPPLSPEDRAQLRSEALTIRGFTAVSAGDLTGALALADVPPEDRPQNPFPRSVFLWSLGFTWRAMGRLEPAAAAFREVMAIGEQLENPYTIMTASTDLGMALRTAGRLHEAEAVYRAAFTRLEAMGARDLGYVGRLESFLALILYEWNRLDDSAAFLERSQAHNRQWGNPNHDLHTALGFVRLALGRRDLAAAASALEICAAGARAPVVKALRAGLELARVRFWLAAGDLASAAAWLQANPPAEPLPGAFDEAGELMVAARARAHLALGQATSALPLLSALEAASRRSDRSAMLIETLVLKALAQPGASPDALAALAEALNLSRADGWTRLYLDEGEPLRRLLETLRPSAPELRPEIDRLLSAFGVLAQAEAAGAAAAAAANAAPLLTLSPREIEILRLVAEGLSNAEIGRRLYIAAGTVKAHTAAIYRKLDAANRIQAVARARDLGLI